MRILFALLMLTGCRDITLETLCIVETSAEKCWIDKENDEGVEYKEMESYFCVSDYEFDIIADRLQQCAVNETRAN